MRSRLISLLTLSPLLGLAPGSQAHVGDVIYPFYELLDEDLDRVDLTDGSVDDWLKVVGEPSLTASDFFWEYGYDPADVDFRIWLAWHENSGTLWIAMDRVDDIYFNLYDGEEPWKMHWWDSSIRFLVDGDHTGGGFSYFRMFNCHECSEEEIEEDNRQAQKWVAIAETPDGEHLFHYAAISEWAGREPYAAAGGGVIGASPVTTVTEFRVTPFDDYIHDDEEASEPSRLYPGKTIGFTISTPDNDDTQAKDGSGVWPFLSLTGSTRALVHADFFVDGLLIGAGESPSLYDDPSAVEPASWARIKASF